MNIFFFNIWITILDSVNDILCLFALHQLLNKIDLWLIWFLVTFWSPNSKNIGSWNLLSNILLNFIIKWIVKCLESSIFIWCLFKRNRIKSNVRVNIFIFYIIIFIKQSKITLCKWSLRLQFTFIRPFYDCAWFLISILISILTVWINYLLILLRIRRIWT